MSLLESLPLRGWATLRAEPAVVLAYWAAGLIHAQYVVERPGVFQARLTAEGRRRRAS